MSADPFLGEIKLFPYNFAPRGWAFCNGQILSTSQNTALFSLLGTTYGGNGQTTFALPDLRGRVPVSSGQGPGLSPYDLGEQGGVETVTLTPGQLPLHSHAVHASDTAGNFDGPTGNFPAALSSNAYRNDTNTTMNPQMVTGGGGGQPHENRQPPTSPSTTASPWKASSPRATEVRTTAGVGPLAHRTGTCVTAAAGCRRRR